MACAAPVLLGFVLPAGLLIHLAWSDPEARWSSRLPALVGNSFMLAGIAAAGCLHALDHHVDRLADDVSARDLQFGDGQWVRGKSLDTFCPVGPALVRDMGATRCRC